MPERTDPARTGVQAGRVVGVCTAGLAVASLVRPEASLYRGTRALLALVGIDSAGLAWAVVAGNALLAVVARYTLCYVVGSLVGVVYDRLGHSAAVLVGSVVVVGLVDATLATLDTRSPLIGAGYLLAWLVYLPVFRWVAPETWTDRDGPVRLG